MVAVYGAQGLIELQLVEVCMHLGTEPFTEALHRFMALFAHLLLAKRATLAKETHEEID
jgi:hypothetical protein